MKGFIVYSTYDIINDKTVVQLFGKLENGQSFVTQNILEPYFFIREEDLKAVEKYLTKYRVEKTNSTNFKGEKVVRIIAPNHRELNKLSEEIHSKAELYEADIKPHTRFLIDHGILSSLDIEGDYQSSEKIDRIYSSPVLKPAHDLKHKLKLISLDIETSSKSDKIICIGMHGENYGKVFMITDKELEHTISCNDEEDMLLKFKSEFLKIDPDIITGWNVIDFDLKQIESAFTKYKIPFDIGRNNDRARLRIEASFMKTSSADIPGRQVLDGLQMIQDPFLQQAPTMRFSQFESYTLEDVSQVILGKGKLLKGHTRCNELDKLYKENTKSAHQKIADYNLNDAKLVYEILEKTDTVSLAVERSELTGMPLDRITSSIAAFDSLYLREEKKHNLVSPTTHYKEKGERLKGGYVFSSGPGIYNNVLVLDFKSLYPSILCTFNIDPSAHLDKEQLKKEKNAIESPNQEYFRNNDGILPEIIRRLHTAREKTKKEKRELASYAIKTIMNSFWGVLASPNCRYFNLGMGNAITAFARSIIQTTSGEIEKMGYKVIYTDTDSVFVETKLEKDKANKLGIEIQNKINKFYKDYVKSKFDRQSYLELQFDKQFISMVIPATRVSLKASKKAKETEDLGTPQQEKTEKEETEEKAAKKRYAGLVEKNGKEELEITGMEAIRGDWTEAAREFQKELLMKLFKKESIEPFIKSYIKKIRDGKLDSQLVYRKSLRKPLEEYVKTTPPHVKAARLLDKVESSVIEYYITSEGPEPLQKLKHKIDYDHYIEKQIAPIADQILALLGKSFEDLAKSSKQTKLF